MEIRNQISNSAVQVDVDAPKGQDLAQVMQDVRSNYEKLAVKNAQDLKQWHENQVMLSKREIRPNILTETILLVGKHLFPFPLLDWRCAGGGIAEHRSSPGSPNGEGRLIQTDTDPGNWTCIPTELSKHACFYILFLFILIVFTSIT